MIQTKKDLAFYIAADRIMNGYPAKRGIINALKESILVGGGKTLIIKYLKRLRRYAYYKNTHRKFFSINSLIMTYERYRLSKLAIKCGFSIGPNSLEYGAVIPHFGTIVVNENSHIGPFSVLHTCTCVAGGGKEIGAYFYLSSGSQLVGEFKLGDNVTVAAHSLVNKGADSNVLIAGTPASVKKESYPSWYERDGQSFENRVKAVLKLKEEMNIS